MTHSGHHVTTDINGRSSGSSKFKFMSVKGQESVLDAVCSIRENRTNAFVRKSDLRGQE